MLCEYCGIDSSSSDGEPWSCSCSSAFEAVVVVVAVVFSEDGLGGWEGERREGNQDEEEERWPEKRR